MSQSSVSEDDKFRFGCSRSGENQLRYCHWKACL